MRWVKASERQPQASDGDVCCDVVCRRYEKSVDGVVGWAVWLWNPLSDGPLDSEDQWLDSAFDDKPTFFEAVKMLEQDYPKRQEMRDAVDQSQRQDAHGSGLGGWVGCG